MVSVYESLGDTGCESEELAETPLLGPVTVHELPVHFTSSELVNPVLPAAGGVM